VRTVDDALIRIKLMIFYELKDIETMVGTDFGCEISANTRLGMAVPNLRTANFADRTKISRRKKR
jgi:hypothetical protein